MSFLVFQNPEAAARRAARLLLCGAIACASIGGATAQSPTSRRSPTVAPKFFGLDVPAGPVRRGSGQVVAARDARGEIVAARVHVEVGDHLILLMPDGQLLARPRGETRASTADFTPETKDALAARLTAGEFKGFQTKQTRRYLYVYNTSETFALATSRILETMFPGVMMYAEAQKIDVREPEVPLLVVMYRDVAEYRRKTNAPEGMVAFYDAVNNRVAMYEQGRLAEVRPDLGVQQAIATIAHEGAHQVLHNIGVQQRLSVWPMWLGEGMAEFFAPTSTDARLKWKGAGKVNDMRMFELEQYFKSRPADADGRLIKDTVGAARLTSTGYATSWALTHYLAKHRRLEFHKFVNEVSRLGPLEGDLRIVQPGVVPGNLELFEKHFGDDYRTMEKHIVAHLKRLPYTDPFADSPHFVAMVTVSAGGRSKRDANVFRTHLLAVKWCKEVIDSLPDEQSRKDATVGVRSFPNKHVAQQFAARWVQGK